MNIGEMKKAKDIILESLHGDETDKNIPDGYMIDEIMRHQNNGNDECTVEFGLRLYLTKDSLAEELGNASERIGKQKVGEQHRQEILEMVAEGVVDYDDERDWMDKHPWIVVDDRTLELW